MHLDLWFGIYLNILEHQDNPNAAAPSRPLSLHASALVGLVPMKGSASTGSQVVRLAVRCTAHVAKLRRCVLSPKSTPCRRQQTRLPIVFGIVNVPQELVQQEVARFLQLTISSGTRIPNYNEGPLSGCSLSALRV